MKSFKSIFSVSNTKTEKQPKTEKPKKPKAKDKADKGKGKGKEKVEPKKRGRPTNAELAAKARIEKEADIAFRKELLERQKAAVSGSLVVTDNVADKTNDPNWVPPWPIFLPGQRVESIFKRGDGKVEKGTVGKDDVNCPSIRVKWDDGSSQYAAKMTLKLVVRKTYEKVFTKSRSKKES